MSEEIASAICKASHPVRGGVVTTGRESKISQSAQRSGDRCAPDDFDVVRVKKHIVEHDSARSMHALAARRYTLQVVARGGSIPRAMHPRRRRTAQGIARNQDRRQRSHARGCILREIGRHVAVADLDQQTIQARRIQFGLRQQSPGKEEQR